MDKSSTSSQSRISTADMRRIVEELMSKQQRCSTAKNYLSVWCQFNKFVMSLDVKPDIWEDSTTLFIGYLIKKGIQSGTIKSYVSAIKKTLVTDGYDWDDKLVLVRSLVKACRIVNDYVRIRLPIHCGLLEVILFEKRYLTGNNQVYLEVLYKTIFALSYYGLMRIGEVTKSPHILRARNVHIATNKNKILLILYSSKTHDESSLPQQIKITANKDDHSNSYTQRHFCPFYLLRKYLILRGDYTSDSEQLFIFHDKSPVRANHAREILKLMINRIGLNSALYGMHNFRIGWTTDLVKYNYPIEKVRVMGRWKSYVIFKYIR